jgi:hypothetical protein
MIVVFPYLAKVKVLPGWEAFAEHNRYFYRGLLIVLTPILLIIMLSYIPGCIMGIERKFVFNGLGLVWIACSIYFAMSNNTRVSKILCPRCRERFDSPRWRHDICRNCGIAAWSPVADQETPIKIGH